MTFKVERVYANWISSYSQTLQAAIDRSLDKTYSDPSITHFLGFLQSIIDSRSISVTSTIYEEVTQVQRRLIVRQMSHGVDGYLRVPTQSASHDSWLAAHFASYARRSLSSIEIALSPITYSFSFFQKEENTYELFRNLFLLENGDLYLDEIIDSIANKGSTPFAAKVLFAILLPVFCGGYSGGVLISPVPVSPDDTFGSRWSWQLEWPTTQKIVLHSSELSEAAQIGILQSYQVSRDREINDAIVSQKGGSYLDVLNNQLQSFT